MLNPQVIVAIPTLASDTAFLDSIRSIERQTRGEVEIVVVDNSGEGRVRRQLTEPGGVRVIENASNVGFGEAVNQAWRSSAAPLLATINDDAVAAPGWIEALVDAMDRHPEAGMCASRVVLAGDSEVLDSAGMVIGADGTSKQRGQDKPAKDFEVEEEVLFPSASAAMYRRRMLDEVGWFDSSFFLYCEDTDLGLRARWAGWKCYYVPAATVTHRYSHSAGKASALKAYLVERNRLAVVARNFPVVLLLASPFYTLARYLWHLAALVRGRGRAGEYRREGNSSALLFWFVLRAHFATAARLAQLWRARRSIRRGARISAREFLGLVRSHYISAREVASL